MARSKSRYATKRDLGLVPHVYNTDSKLFHAGVPEAERGKRLPVAKRECQPRKGRHCLVGA